MVDGALSKFDQKICNIKHLASTGKRKQHSAWNAPRTMTKDWHYLVAKALQGSQTHTGDYREAKHRSAWNAPNHQPKTSTTWGMAKASTGKQHRPLCLERPNKPNREAGQHWRLQGSSTGRTTWNATATTRANVPKWLLTTL